MAATGAKAPMEHKGIGEFEDSRELSSMTIKHPNPKDSNAKDESPSELNPIFACFKCVFDELWGKRFFLYFLIIAIAVAAAYPEAGRKGGPMQPSITVSWVAVILIFFITGLKLKTKELGKAAAYWNLNLYVLAFTYIFIPGTVFVLTLLLRLSGYNELIIDGLVVMSCLPTTISMCVILTKTGNGNEAAAVFNATVSNFLGIFLTPALLLLLLGESGSVSITDIILKLIVRVVVPVAGGQLIRHVLPCIVPWITRNGKALKRFSEILLLYIVWATFCQTFYIGIDAEPEEFGILLAILIPLHLAYVCICLYTATCTCLGYQREDVIAVLFCSTEKTVALGIPLITAIYEDTGNAGILSIPVLIYHPMQLVVGSLMVPWLASWASTGKIMGTGEADNEDSGEGSSGDKHNSKNASVKSASGPLPEVKEEQV